MIQDDYLQIEVLKDGTNDGCLVINGMRVAGNKPMWAPTGNILSKWDVSVDKIKQAIGKSKHIKELEAENQRLRDGWMRSECIKKALSKTCDSRFCNSRLGIYCLAVKEEVDVNL